MSNHLAIATVTRALGDLVLDAARFAVSGADVSYLRPGSTQPAPASPGVNLFLYGVTPNAALRNGDLPTRRSGGTLAQRSAIVVDLHYLLTFYGDELGFEPQRMLGSVARALAHEPHLTRPRIEGILAGQLAASNLADAPERVRFVPATLNLEELSKLWSVLFQTPYALSMVLQAGPVTLDSEVSPSPALPVRDRNLYVVPLVGPSVDSVVSGAGPGAPILPDSVLVLRGRGLRGEVTRLRLGAAGGEVEPVSVTPAEVRVPLAAVPAGELRAGVQGVQVLHRRMMGTPPVPHRGEESNVAAFVLRPVVRPQVGNPALDDVVFTPAVPLPAPGTPPRLAVRVTPVVGARQRAELLLNEQGGSGRAFRVPAGTRTTDGDLLEFDVPGLDAGSWLVRVVVDGAESVLASAPDGSWHRPRVVVP